MRVKSFRHKGGSVSWGVLSEEDQWLSGMFRSRRTATAWMQGYMKGVAYARGLTAEFFDNLTKEVKA